MKRWLTLISCVLILAAVLTGCGQATMADSKYLGTWKATTCEYDGYEMETEAVIGEFSLELQETGKYIAVLAGDSEDGKWAEVETGGVQLDGDSELVFTPDGERLVLDYSDIKIYFERQ